jgi:mannosyl-oligosaccharide alpha-1,2-mannosidase
MTVESHDILISGLARAGGDAAPTIEPSCQHLVCFAGGMVGIAAKIFDRPDDLPIARKLVDGCIWAYESMPIGIMAEVSHLVPCDDVLNCPWDEAKWYAGIMDGILADDSGTTHQSLAESRIRENRLPAGYTKIDDRRYILRYFP